MKIKIILWALFFIVTLSMYFLMTNKSPRLVGNKEKVVQLTGTKDEGRKKGSIRTLLQVRQAKLGASYEVRVFAGQGIVNRPTPVQIRRVQYFVT